MEHEIAARKRGLAAPAASVLVKDRRHLVDILVEVLDQVLECAQFRHCRHRDVIDAPQPRRRVPASVRHDAQESLDHLACRCQQIEVLGRYEQLRWRDPGGKAEWASPRPATGR